MEPLKLSKPIKTPDHPGTATSPDLATEIVFKRRATAGDLKAAGLSLRMATADVELSVEQVHIITERCTGIPKACLETLDAADWLQLYGEVVGFFAPAESGPSA